MLVSIAWLEKIIPSFQISAIGLEKLTEKLTLAGLEVVETTKLRQRIPGLVIGEVLDKQKHPNADKLNVTKVKTSTGEEQIVCGARNVDAGQKVIVATIGTQLTKDFKIKPTKIRDIQSNGMICSKEELGIEEENGGKSEGIYVLPSSASLSEDVQKYIGEEDCILDIDLTSNRGDCNSIYGVAREVAVLFDLELPNSFKDTNESFISSFSENTDSSLQHPYPVTLEKTVEKNKACQRYVCLPLYDLDIKPSSPVISQRLLDHQHAVINNVVDITNYLLLKQGQPLHAFDLDKIVGEIVIRYAKTGEEFLAINDQILKLTSEDLVIADKEKVLALAGIIGGKESAISDDTKNILLEAAYFSNEGIFKSTKRHSLNTESSMCFTKKVPVLGEVNKVLGEVVLALQKQSPQIVIKNKIQDVTIDTGETPKQITLRHEYLLKRLGLRESDLSIEVAKGILTKLYFKIIEESSEKITVEIPPFRKDIDYEWDLVEEIGRIYGYDNIPEKIPYISNNNFSLYTSHRAKDTNFARGLGYHEIISYSFVKEDFNQKCLLSDDSANNLSMEDFATLSNPISNEYSFLRNSLLFGMLSVWQTNRQKQNLDFNKCFERGKVFLKQKEKAEDNSKNASDGSYLEKEQISFLNTQYLKEAHWRNNSQNSSQNDKKGHYDFYDLAGEVTSFLQNRGFSQIEIISSEENIFSISASAKVLVNKQNVGRVGLISSSILKYFKINESILYAELNLTKINALSTKKKKYKPLSIYPAIYRDLAVVIDEQQNVREILTAINKSHPLVKEVTLDNIYQGDNIPQEKRSIAFKIKILSSEKTLSKEEGDKVIGEILEKLNKKKIQFDLR